MVHDNQPSSVRKTDEMRSLTPSRIFPRVVHRHYFDLPGVPDVAVEPKRFGFVRSLGNDLISFLAYSGDRTIRNIHQEHLDRLGLSLDEANKIAIENVRRIAFDGTTIKQLVTKTNNGNDWAVWLGNDFTSSCLLLPDLYSWSQKHLNADSFLVRAASTQMVFVLQYKNRGDLARFDRYISKVLEGSNNLVSPDWFVLTRDSLTPLGKQ